MNKNIFNNYLSSFCSVPYGGYLILSVGKEGGSGCLKIYKPFFYIQCNEMKICLSDISIACLWLSKHFECGQMPYLSLEYIKCINLIKIYLFLCSITVFFSIFDYCNEVKY